MGVKGLWPMLESAAAKTELRAAHGKVLSVDVSIWIQQIVKGMRDGRGDPIPNAHIIGLIARIVKLLHFGIKPIFVYDGGTPALKAATVSSRRTRRAAGAEKLEEARSKILRNRMKRYALGDKSALSTARTKGKAPAADGWEADMFDPNTDVDLTGMNGESDEDDNDDSGDAWYYDASKVDFDSADFRGLPYEIQHEILVERQEAEKDRSQRSKMAPFTDADSFSRDQVTALKTRNKLSRLLDDIRSKLLCIDSDNGISYHKIVSEENTVYILEKRPEPERPSLPIGTDGTAAASSTASPPASPTKVLRGIARRRFRERKQEAATSSQSTHREGEGGIDTVDADASSTVVSDDDSLSFAGSSVAPSDNEDETEHEPDVDAAGMAAPTGIEAGETLATTVANDMDVGLQEALLASVGSAAGYVDAHTQDAVTHVLANVQPTMSHADKKSHVDGMEVDTPMAPHDVAQPLVNDVIAPNHGAWQQRLETERHDSGASVQPTHETAAALTIQHEAASPSRATASATVVADNTTRPIPSSTPTEALTATSAAVESTCATHVTPPQFTRVTGPSSRQDDAAHPPGTVDVSSSSSDEDDEELVEVPVIRPALEPEMTTATGHRARAQVPSIESTLESGVSFNHVNNVNTAPVPSVTEEQTDDKRHDDVSTSPEMTDRVDGSRKHDDHDIDNVDMTEDMLSDEEIAHGITVKDITSGNTSAASASAALVQERYGLDVEAKKAAQAAAGVTAGMMAETQALLRMFGLPYMVAPMEAEAQCAALEIDGVTEGTITDDSDVFLFGGQTVYRRVCSATKDPEVYSANLLLQYLGLDREKLIRLAYLLGCDYTNGIDGIGVVTAMEVLAEFPGDTCLDRFKAFMHSDDPVGNRVRQGLKRRKTPYLIPDAFPDPRVTQAFLAPQVEHKSPGDFEWGDIDVDEIRRVAYERLGWSDDRVDQALTPALHPSKKSAQRSMSDFFSAADPAQIGNLGRKRFNAAVARVKRMPSGASAKHGKGRAEATEEETPASSASPDSGRERKRQRKNGKARAKKS
eukprot:m.32361 g.32361  ORF g.32361 m.32361 type:complete len:1041 (-) comp4884_c0_seq1:1134-4256(-)